MIFTTNSHGVDFNQMFKVLLSHHVLTLSTCFLSQVNETRVILKDTDPDVVGSDYINANYVRVSLQSLWPHSNTE